MVTVNTLRVASLAAVLVAGSCTAPNAVVEEPRVFADGAVNHPISVAPGYRTLKLAYPGPHATLGSNETMQLEEFAQDYQAHGNGTLTLSAPRGPDSSETIEYFASQLLQLGVPRERLLVGTHDAGPGDGRVEIGYVSYVAHTEPCGNWTQDATDTEDNLPMPDFGCSVQHNIAAMVADPRDLVSPREMSPADATRRNAVVKQYETGKTTSADKTSAQSGAVSDVAGGGH